MVGCCNEVSRHFWQPAPQSSMPNLSFSWKLGTWLKDTNSHIRRAAAGGEGGVPSNQLRKVTAEHVQVIEVSRGYKSETHIWWARAGGEGGVPSHQLRKVAAEHVQARQRARRHRSQLSE